MIVQELYIYFTDIRNCYIPTFIFIILITLGFVWNCWRNMLLLGDKKTNFWDYLQISIGLLILVLCGFSILGFLIASEQFEKLYEALGLMYYLDKLAYYVQMLLLKLFEYFKRF